MTADPGESGEEGGRAQAMAVVAANVLSAFFDELAAAPGLEEKAHELRRVVLKEGIMSEAAIRAILFPDAP